MYFNDLCDCLIWFDGVCFLLLSKVKSHWWRTRGLTTAARCSTFVLMEVQTLGVARSLGWKVHMRCANGYRQETRSMRRCVYRKQLDLETLVATRGPNFPLSRLESRLMCPACGNRRVTVVFEPPTNSQSLADDEKPAS